MLSRRSFFTFLAGLPMAAKVGFTSPATPWPPYPFATKEDYAKFLAYRTRAVQRVLEARRLVGGRLSDDLERRIDELVPEVVRRAVGAR